MWQLVHAHANCRPAKLAITDGQLALDYQTLMVEVAGLAKQLTTACPGTRPLIVCVDNSPAWVLLDLALMLLKRCAVPIPGFFTAAQMEYVAAQSGAEFVIKEGSIGDNDLNVAGKKLHVQHIFPVPVALLPGTAKITFTSGSTGQPKGVCLSAKLMESVAFSLVDAIGEENAGIHCAILPLSVLLENVAGLYTTLIAGGSYHVASSASIGLANPFMPDFGVLAKTLARQSATSAILVPEMLLGLMHALSTAKQKLPKLKFLAVGGAKVSSSLLEHAAALGLPVYQGYGLSEAASVVAVNTPKSNKPGSVGRVLPHVKLRFGGDGEILLQTPDLLGYVGRPLDHAGFATADVGHVDRDGFLFIDGRKSNVIITSFGRNISPEWIESELLANPQIGHSMVYGEAAPFLSALIVPAAPEVTDDSIAKAVVQTNLRLPAYAHVRQWFRANRFTAANGMLTANGRLQRPAINKEYSGIMTTSPANTNKPARFFEKLISETVEERNYLLATKQIQDGLAGHISLETYLHYLAEAYYHVRHTVPLLALAR
ncbi:MAG: AMP-binding protein, partial [Aestuariivirga sp.]